MTTIDRRAMLRGMGAAAVAASLPETIKKALAIQPAAVTGTIMDVQHIVVLMQENRSFDHYFGTLRGVRGFGDPRAVTLTTGNSVFNQTSSGGTGTSNTGSNPLQPFRPATANQFGYQFIGDLSHAWSDAHSAWNYGNNDGWVAAKGTETMIHYQRSDIPFHYALADAFTICDNYHCSIMSSTDPNRYYLWTGWTGNGVVDTVTNPTSGAVQGSFTLSSGNGTGAGGPCINNSEENGNLGYLTFPERLSAAGVTWKFYQDNGGTNLANTDWGYTSNGYIGNYGDSSVLWFKQYQLANTHVHAGTTLTTSDTYCVPALNGTNISAATPATAYTPAYPAYTPAAMFTQLQADVAAGTLPQVSWIVAPYLYSEHPAGPPNWGAWYVEQVLAALVSNPAVWAKTVFIINFDENDGFFDHLVAPTAPQSSAYGLSTVGTANEIYPAITGASSPTNVPYGLGARVPCLVISPWSKGGYVCSQVFDHTSVLQFIGKRFGVTESHITPWRSCVSGDLTSALNFAAPTTGTAHLPSTSTYLSGPTGTVGSQTLQALTTAQISANKTTGTGYFSSFSLTGQYPTTPTSLPQQEAGTRLARPLPYQLQADAVVGTSAVTITFQSTGTAGSWFHVRNGVKVNATNTYGLATSATVIGHKNAGNGTGPWGYTVDPVTQTLSDTFTPTTTSYDLSVYSANGFFRRYAGTLGSAAANLNVALVYNLATGGVTLTVTNKGTASTVVTVAEGYSVTSQQQTVAPNASFTTTWALTNSYSWYDLTVTTSTDATFVRHYAGHVETGADSVSDPWLANKQH